ncbi:MAG: diaminopimelate epimerase [Caryophanon sp.]|nr:diaminopimelate epimerase [Caryophanon sp.]
MDIPFTKMHGLGNNYIYINMFDYTLDEQSLQPLAIAISDVNRGIGADGMVLICPSAHAHCQMRIFNKDGSEASNCGNALRCVAKFVYDRGIVTGENFTIETKSGLNYVQLEAINGVAQSITINMGQPKFERAAMPMNGEPTSHVINEPFIVDGETLHMTNVFLGNPHAVFFVDAIEHAPLYTLGEKIERHDVFPERTNVEFIEVLNEREMNFRVWERGSGVTEACGTGACGAVVAAIVNDRCARDEEVTVHLAGGDLIIKWDAAGDVWMTGPAAFIADGMFFYA